VAAAILDESGRVLMQKRRAGAQHGGLWEFPGGKVEAGESPESALCREIREELGLAIEPAALVPAGSASSADLEQPGERSLVILLYICRRWQGDPLCLDGEEIAWIAVEEVEKLAMPPLDYPLARGLVEMLAQERK
jgi:8-oxo-dGTP diphosphatase